MSPVKNRSVWIGTLLLIIILGFAFVSRFLSNSESGFGSKRERHPVPVEVADVQQGQLSLYRTFSGSMEAQAKFTVASKVSGRIERLHVDVSDAVKRGQLVAELEDAEFRQAVTEAEARLAVARAKKVEAQSRLEIAQRELERTRSLHQRGIASDSTYDTAQAEFLASQAALEVAEADLKREDAALAAARIRLGYTKLMADWEKGDDERIVAERYGEEGDTVPANTPLYSIVELDPVEAVVQVTEKDYPRIRTGQQVTLETDAFPDRSFTGTVSRIAPIFRESSRQARVEINVPNAYYLLKPGMFVLCTLELERFDEAVSVPEPAVTKRNDQEGVFLVSDDGTGVKWIEIKQGIRTRGRVQVIEPPISGQVVTLGHQLIEDGSSIRIARDSSQSMEGVRSQ